ncbi:ROK family protein [Williamsoniiplasma lucivorax]|uniref:ROK family protein n=1 Tax=Williamsoniiplasma lucivorax TaxID=209274 RepID=A0A2S5RA32_9MOLU|nr:ROK family protein [Williamsoniiplasma lucivorax]PPE04168.1 hypothetical protein ELUCI_v1c09480 [Williamsoniiplasma lucivorax]
MKKICFDIGGSSIKVITFNEKNEIVSRDKLDHIGTKKYSFASSDMDKLKQELPDFKIDSDLIKSIPLIKCLENINNYVEKLNEKVKIGISIPGVVDNKKYKVLTESAICEVDVDILGFFKNQKLVDEIVIENDGKAAAIGEMVYGQDNKLTNAIILTVGTALGGGIIINKKVYKGSHLQAGEFSKTLANINKHTSYISNLAVSTLSTVMVCMAYKMMSKTSEFIDGFKFFELVEKNDPLAIQLFDNWVKSLTNFLINLNMFDPEKFLIGGGVSANKIFMDALKKEVEKIDYTVLPKIYLESCKLTNDAACYGMLAIIEKEYIEE